MKHNEIGTIWYKSKEQAVEFQKKNKQLIANEGATENLTEKMLF